MDKRQQEYSIFGRHVGYVIAANLLTLILGLIQIPILTKALGPSLYGTWALIITSVSLIVPFAVLSLSTSIVRFLASEKDINVIREDFYSALGLVLLTSMVFSLIFFLASNILATYIFKDPGASSYIRLSSVSILMSSVFLVLLAIFRSRRNIGEYSILNSGLSFLQIGLTITLLLLGYKLLGVVVSAIISVTIMDGIAIAIILKRLKFARPRFSNMKLYLKWGILLTPNDAVMWIINASDKFIVNYFLGASATGIYNASYGIGFYAAFAVYPLGMVLYPYLTKAYTESRDDCSNYLKYSFKYLMMVTIPAAVGLAVLAKSLLLIFTTSEFLSGSSVTIFSALAAIFFCFYQLFQYVLYLTDKTTTVIKLLAIAAVLNVILNLIFVPIMGITGAGISSFLAYGILGGLTLFISRKMIKFDLNIAFLIKSLLASSLMGVCIWLIKPGSIIMLFSAIIIGVLIYFGALILLKGLSKDELGFFASFIRKNFESVFVRKSRS